jgi:hypothetical protein
MLATRVQEILTIGLPSKNVSWRKNLAPVRGSNFAATVRRFVRI